jgi:hypothetical protein
MFKLRPVAVSLLLLLFNNVNVTISKKKNKEMSRDFRQSAISGQTYTRQSAQEIHQRRHSAALLTNRPQTSSHQFH